MKTGRHAWIVCLRQNRSASPSLVVRLVNAEGIWAEVPFEAWIVDGPPTNYSHVELRLLQQIPRTERSKAYCSVVLLPKAGK